MVRTVIISEEPPPLNLPHLAQVLEDAAGGGAVLEVAGADELAERARPVLAPIAEHLRAAHGELARRAAAAAHAPHPPSPRPPSPAGAEPAARRSRSASRSAARASSSRPILR